jgi:hypothetical protein
VPLGTVVLDEKIFQIDELELVDGVIRIHAHNAEPIAGLFDLNGRYVVYGVDGRSVGSGKTREAPNLIAVTVVDTVRVTVAWAVDKVIKDGPRHVQGV